MENIFHALLLTLLHSLWQSALMALLFVGYLKVVKNTHPQILRFIAATGIVSQLIFSIISFTILSWNPASGLALPTAELFSRIPTSIEFFASWIYIIISSALVIRTVFNWFHFRKTVRTGYQKASLDIRLFTSQTALQLGIKRKVQVFLSEKIAVPVTFGFFKPIVLLPIALINQLSVKETESIILHELEHIRSVDYIINWIAILAENIFFFNPFIYYLTSQLYKTRETNCDAVVLDFKYNLSDYASALYKAASLSAGKPAFVLALSGKKPTGLKSRILEMRDFYPEFKKRRIWFSLGFALALSISTFLLTTSHLKKETPTAFQVDNSSHAEQAKIFHTIPVTSVSDKHEEQLFISGIPEEKKVVEKVAIKKPVTEIENKQADNSYPMVNVSMQEQEAPKEITIREEDAASGSVITTHYLLMVDSGNYKMKLLWKIEESRLPDSLISMHGDSSVIYIPQARFEQ